MPYRLLWLVRLATRSPCSVGSTNAKAVSTSHGRKMTSRSSTHWAFRAGSWFSSWSDIRAPIMTYSVSNVPGRSYHHRHHHDHPSLVFPPAVHVNYARMACAMKSASRLAATHSIAALTDNATGFATDAGLPIQCQASDGGFRLAAPARTPLPSLAEVAFTAGQAQRGTASDGKYRRYRRHCSCLNGYAQPSHGRACVMARESGQIEPGCACDPDLLTSKRGPSA
jgi:hypothetical protein